MARRITAWLGQDGWNGAGRAISVPLRESRARRVSEMYEPPEEEEDEYTADGDEEDPSLRDFRRGHGNDDTEEGDLEKPKRAQMQEDDEDEAAERLSRAMAVLQDEDLSDAQKVRQLSRLLGASAPAVESLRRGRPRNAVSLLEGALRRAGRKGIDDLDRWSHTDLAQYLRGARARR